ncbi:HNH endonuclease [Spirosoma foliorum]|uniref:HNH endonuclease 5 domain-containing protein n=1 Tax=Spirosoma foliorum TaxID=2710596 RepID=A0A7G5H2T2_9BACT|nr:hypothetical protein H3H32_11280 [Spirosoma foliorum]
MRCIFCKQDSSGSRSVEHIVPESLGNKSHVLPTGVVCDRCNQYFALKIEKVLLEQEFFKNLRHRNAIESKRGRISPSEKVLGTITFSEGEIYISNKGMNVVTVDPLSAQFIMSEW